MSTSCKNKPKYQIKILEKIKYTSACKLYWHRSVKICYLVKCQKHAEEGPQSSYITTIWAASSKFVSSSIPSWQILTAHAQPFRGARDLAFCLKVPLDSMLVWASSGGSGETAQMRRLAWTFAACICDKYQICLTRPIYQQKDTVAQNTE